LESENPETPLYRSKLYIQLNEDEKALRLAKDALELSLVQLGKSQEQMQGQMQSQGFYGVMNSETTRQDTETLDRLSGESFDWFTDTFHESDVTPLLGRLLEQYPLSARLYSMTGSYHKEKGSREQALQYLEEAVRLAPSLSDAHYHLGELYHESGDNTKAIRSYRRARSLSPDWPQAYRALIDIHRKSGGLDDLCDRWLAMYRAAPQDEILRSHLIEALHKADRIEEASEIVRNHKSD
ncbi:MAG: tetratricopeptide repeat protein, partial [Bacteroidota bacterium]